MFYGEIGSGLHAACFTGQTEIVKYLLRNHHNLNLIVSFRNRQGNTALELAQIHCYDDIMILFRPFPEIDDGKYYGEICDKIDKYDFTGSTTEK